MVLAVPPAAGADPVALPGHNAHVAVAHGLLPPRRRSGGRGPCPCRRCRHRRRLPRQDDNDVRPAHAWQGLWGGQVLGVVPKLALLELAQGAALGAPLQPLSAAGQRGEKGGPSSSALRLSTPPNSAELAVCCLPPCRERRMLASSRICAACKALAWHSAAQHSMVANPHAGAVPATTAAALPQRVLLLAHALPGAVPPAAAKHVGDVKHACMPQ